MKCLGVLQISFAILRDLVLAAQETLQVGNEFAAGPYKMQLRIFSLETGSNPYGPK